MLYWKWVTSLDGVTFTCSGFIDDLLRLSRCISVVNGHTAMIAWREGGNLADSCAFVTNVLNVSTPADRRVESGPGAV